MRGDFILVDKKLKNMRFLFFVVALLIINISVTFECQSVIIDISKKEKDINELRLKSITTKSQLASLTKRTEIEKIVREIKLFTSIGIAPQRSMRFLLISFNSSIVIDSSIFL